MCAYSMIADYAQRQWPAIAQGPVFASYPLEQGPTKEQFEELLELLRAAQRFDEATNQPGCEDRQKRLKLQQAAARLGLDMKGL